MSCGRILKVFDRASFENTRPHLSDTMCIAIVFLKRTDLKCFEAVAPATCIEYFTTHVHKKISLDAVFATARAQSAYIHTSGYAF